MIVDSASNEFLMASSSYHREKVKLELYKALSDTPLAFFDVHSFDDVEEMVFYINDLEGVDVHVKKYIIMSIKAVLNVIAKVGTISATVDARGTFLILLIVISIASPLEWILKSIAAIYRPVASETFGDIEEIENMGSAGSRVLLNGLQIIENVHTLRPFGADSQLMEWWVGHIEELQDRRDCVHEKSPLKSVNNDRFALFATSSRVLNIIFNRVVGRLRLRNTIYWTSPLLLSINSLIQMMLPLITSSMIQSSTGSSFVSPTLVSEVISSLEGLLKACTSGKDLWDLMLRNAHKAHVLNVLLSYSNKNVISSTKLIAPGLSINDLINGVRLGDVTPVMVDISDLSFAYPSRPDRLIFNKFENENPFASRTNSSDFWP